MRPLTCLSSLHFQTITTPGTTHSLERLIERVSLSPRSPCISTATYGRPSRVGCQIQSLPAILASNSRGFCALNPAIEVWEPRPPSVIFFVHWLLLLRGNLVSRRLQCRCWQQGRRDIPLR